MTHIKSQNSTNFITLSLPPIDMSQGFQHNDTTQLVQHVLDKPHLQYSDYNFFYIYFCVYQ